MIFRLKRINNEFYLLDSEDIKKDEWFVYHTENKIVKATNNINVHNNKTHSRIIASTKSLTGTKLLEVSECYLVSGTTDVTKLADEYTKYDYNQDRGNIERYNSFIDGFNKHSELRMDYKFTLKEIVKAAQYIWKKRNDLQKIEHVDFTKKDYQELLIFIQSNTNEYKSEWEVEIAQNKKYITIKPKPQI